MQKIYNVILPRLDYTGPSNVARDLACAAKADGYIVNMFYIGSTPSRSDIDFVDSCRKLNIKDLFCLSGIVHSHGMRPDILNGLIAIFNTKCKTYSTLHGQYPHHIYFDYHYIKVLLAWVVWRFFLSYLNGVVCISRTMHRYYRRTSPELKTHIVYNSRSIQTTSKLKSNLNFDQWMKKRRLFGSVIIAYVGSLTERKGILQLLKLAENNPNVSIAICGDGPLRPEVQNFGSVLTGKDIYLGYQNNPSTLISLSDALILPSRAEGFPLVVLEAFNLGKPTVLSNIAVHRELESIGLGFVYKRSDPADLERVIRKSLSLHPAPNKQNFTHEVATPERCFKNYKRVFELHD